MSNSTNTKQVNINNHSENEFKDMMQDALSSSGIQLTASKNFGKTRMLFSMASYLQNLEDSSGSKNSRVLIFDPSMAWLFGYSKIPVFCIHEEDITATEQKTALDVEQYSLRNWEMVKLALRTYKDILFELKTRKPSKRGFFTRTVILYLDSIQRREIEQTANHEPQKSVSFFIEEFEGTFSNRATLRTDSEEFQAVFNECRNMKESFFTCSQRENDCSKTLRTKQLQLYGKIPECDKSPYHRRLEKQFNVNFSNLPQRNWIYSGKVIISPTWKQEGKPYLINRMLRAKYSEPKPKKSLAWRYLEFINRIWNGQQSDNSNTEENKEDLEDSQGDSLFIDKDVDSETVLFPEEFPE